MNRILISILFLALTSKSIAQVIGEDVQETIPAFGFCIMPNNNTFLSLEADYDGMYITERELVDLFETGRFNFSSDLLDWTYYSYWALNERTLEQPNDYTFYQMTVDPTGTYVAIASAKREGWNTSIQLFDKGSQTKVAEFDVSTINENIYDLNQVRFDKEGKNLLLGAGELGVYSYSLETKELSTLYTPYTYYLHDYNYINGSPILKKYIKEEGDEYYLDTDLFTLNGDNQLAITLPLPLHYTRILTPTETHKYYGLFYEQEYDTYLAPIDDFNYQIIYRNKKTFVFITREVPKE